MAEMLKPKVIVRLAVETLSACDIAFISVLIGKDRQSFSPRILSKTKIGENVRRDQRGTEALKIQE